jgi:hypothetical protein
MYAFATTPVHGLGMTGPEFWSSTPREFAARRKVFEQSREYSASLYAGLQATLHNAHFRTERSQPVFTAEMFLPGYRAASRSKPDESWRTFKALAEGRERKKTPEERAALETLTRDFEMRQSRAAAAKANGAGRAEVIAIMEGS